MAIRTFRRTSLRPRITMRKHLFRVALLCVAFATAEATDASCDFQSVGDPRNGLLFVAKTQRPALTLQSALGQFQQIASDAGYELGSELITGDSGRLSFLQTSNNPALVFWVDADSSGNVSLSVKLARGQKTDAAAVKSEFCTLLGKLKSGPEGETLASAARARHGLGRVIAADAVKLSADLGREVKSVLSAPAAKGKLSKFLIGTGTYATSGEYQEAFAPMEAKYLGRKYEIDGQIYTVSRNTITGEMQLNYLVTPKRGLLGIKQEGQYNNLNFQIHCTLAKDQQRLFATLTEGNWVKLTGTVTEIRPDGLELTDCRQAN